MIDSTLTEGSTTRDTPQLEAKRGAGSFAIDVLKLVSGATFAQALGALASPLLTRLYGPDALGIAAIFTSISGIIGGVLCLRYELAIMLPESDEEAANLFAGSLLVALLMSLLSVPAIWLGGPWLVRVLNAAELAPYLWLLPPVIFFGGVALGHPALNSWASRTRRFGRLSLTQVINALFTIVAQLAAGLAGYGTGGSLIGGSVLGSIVSTAVLAVRTWRDDGARMLRTVHWRDMAAGLKRHAKFPIYSTWSNLLNNISWQLPAFLLSAFFSSTVVGFYALGNRLLRLPMSLVGGAIGRVFFQQASVAKLEGKLDTVVESSFRMLVVLGMFPMLLLTIVGRDIFVVAFGERWAEAGVYTQILSVWSFFLFVSSPLSMLFSVLEKQEFDLAWNGVNIVTRFLSLWIGGIFHSARLAVLLFGLSGILVYGYLNLAIMAAAGVSWRRAARIVLWSFAVFAPAGLALLLLDLFHVHILIRCGAACAILGIYYLYVVASDPQVRGLAGALIRMAGSRIPGHGRSHGGL